MSVRVSKNESSSSLKLPYSEAICRKQQTRCLHPQRHHPHQSASYGEESSTNSRHGSCPSPNMECSGHTPASKTGIICWPNEVAMKGEADLRMGNAGSGPKKRCKKGLSNSVAAGKGSSTCACSTSQKGWISKVRWALPKLRSCEPDNEMLTCKSCLESKEGTDSSILDNNKVAGCSPVGQQPAQDID